MLNFIMLNVIFLNAIMLNVITLNVIMLNVVTLSVVAPLVNSYILLAIIAKNKPYEQQLLEQNLRIEILANIGS
jgi:hypothetical protein